MGFSSRKSSSSSAASGIMFLSVRAEKSSPQKTFRGCRQHRPLCPSGNSSPESASLPLPFSGSNASPLLASAKVSATFPDARRRPPDKRAWRLRGSANYRSEEHTSELQSLTNLVCRLLLESSLDQRDLHSFPTRRSSDLTASPALSVWKLFSRICFIAAALLWKQCVAALGLSESLRYVSGRAS